MAQIKAPLVPNQNTSEEITQKSRKTSAIFLISMKKDTPQSLPHEYPQQLAYQH